MDDRRAGLFCQHQQCQRWPVQQLPQSMWLWLRSSVVRRSSTLLCRPSSLRSDLLCTSDDLLCTSDDLLQHRLQQLLQKVLLLQDAKASLPQDSLP
ncbi:MAG: hypothetical protein NTW75_07885 [Planctomycetales bacterium]|jgi:hypothetical protein|nr:hypothetical protein [Planctomycetales bacterium]